MATELFITKEFSQEMILAGELLIKCLEEKNSQVHIAFWLLDTEENTWKLIIGSPLVENEGSRNYYKRVNDINKKITTDNIISLHNIEIVNQYNRFVKALMNVKNSSLWDDKYWKNTRLGKNFLGHVYFEDLYIYRITQL